MDRKIFLYMGVGFLLVFGLQMFAPKKASVAVQAPVATEQKMGAAETAAKKESIKDVHGELLDVVDQKEIQLASSVVTLGSKGEIFSGWKLPTYPVPGEKTGEKVSMKQVIAHTGVLDFAFDHPDFEYLNRIQGTLGRMNSGENQNSALWIYEDEKVRLERAFAWEPTTDILKVVLRARFKSKSPGYAFVSTLAELPPEEAGPDHSFIFWKATEKATENQLLTDAKGLEITKPKEVLGPLSWMAAVDRYFIFGVLSESAPKGLVQMAPGGGRASLVYPVSGDSIEIPLKVFFGPKKLTYLRAIDPTLDHVVDLGWFTFAAYPILDFMNYLYKFIGNYGIAIIILTIILKILTFPLTYKSMKSMKDMAKIQPQITRLREKYADDKEKLNKEMIGLMKNSGYNPVAGCLPMLIQIPIFIALYRVLYSSIELYQAPFGLWIHDLSIKDPFYITPIVLTIVMVVQQRLTPTQMADPMQAKMMQFMPIMFGLMMISLPAGLTIYMLTNAVASILQQLYLNKKLDIHPTVVTPVKA